MKLDEREDLASLTPGELEARRYGMLAELGVLDMEVQRRAKAGRIHVPADEWRKNGIPRGPGGMVYRVVTPSLGFNIRGFHVFILEVPARSEPGKYHIHGDAVKYYLSGRGVELVGEDRYEIGPGDFVHIPAGVWHGTQNPHDEPILILAVSLYPGAYSQVPAPFVSGPALEPAG